MTNALSVTVEEIDSRYEDTIPADKTAWVQQKTDAAVRELLNMIPTLQSRVDTQAIDREFVVDKVADAVLRVVRGPEGYASESEGEYSYKLNARVVSGDLWFPEEDLLQLGWVKPGASPSVVRTVYATPSRGFGFPI